MGMPGRPGPSAAVVRARIRVPAAAGLRRARLVAPLVGLSAPRLVLVVAPPGSGKSMLLAQVAEAARMPTAWITLDTGLVEVAPLLAHLRAAFEGRVAGLAPDWPTAETALADLEENLTTPVLLVLDDVHSVDREPGTEVVQLLVRHQPELLRIALGSRTVPDVDMPRWVLTGSAVEIDADTLRFRTWEVEELFRHCHGVRLRADEVSTLTRRTDGWAAGLQLFHLATAHRPPSSRAALISGTGSAGRLSRDYLARHVLERIDPEQREFLVRSSVLDELTARRCDVLTGSTGSARVLSELDHSGLFTTVTQEPEGDGPSYSYHEVLRSHLLEELLARLGAEQARALHRRAADLLEQEGALAAAIRSYCRAQAWEDVRRLLTVGGASLADDRGTWLDLIPATIRDRDPWVLLALARRLVADGVLDRAAETYRQALNRFAPSGGGRIAAEELRLLQAWIEPAFGVITDWVHVARAALVDPRGQLRAVRTAGGRHDFARGLALLATGALPEAADVLTTVLSELDVPVPAEAAALLSRAMALTLAGQPAAAVARQEAIAAAKLVSAPVLGRLADGLQAVATGDDSGTVEHLVSECTQVGDRWGGALLRLFTGMAGLPAGAGSAEPLWAAEQEFRGLAAPALAAWAAAAAAIAAAHAGQPCAKEKLAEIESAAKAVGPLPYALALLAAAAGSGSPADAERARALALQLAGGCGATAWARRIAAHTTPAGSRATTSTTAQTSTTAADLASHPVGTSHPVGAPPQGRIRIRCLGGFRLEVAGAVVDLDGLRPQHQALLRLLCLHGNRSVHSDRLLGWFWPGHDPERGQHSLQVAVSGLRRLLEPAVARGGWTVLVRTGSGYRLALDSDDDCDVRTLEAHLRAGEQALRSQDEASAIKHLQAGVMAYTGDLLPDDGAAEWVVDERERLRGAVAGACEQLATLHAAHARHAEATRVAQQGLRHDRYRDGLWLRLIESLQVDGNLAAAASARTAYREVLAEMGIDEYTS